MTGSMSGISGKRGTATGTSASSTTIGGMSTQANTTGNDGLGMSIEIRRMSGSILVITAIPRDSCIRMNVRVVESTSTDTLTLLERDTTGTSLPQLNTPGDASETTTNRVTLISDENCQATCTARIVVPLALRHTSLRPV